MKRIFIFSCIILSCMLGFTQVQIPDSITLENRIYHPDILSMKIEKIGKMFEMPVILLNSSEQLQLTFDDKSDNSKYLRYTFIHCDYDWKSQTPINKNEYMGMFEDMEIYDYQTSINTIQFFTSYTITFPNNDMQITKSGNYIIYVYDDETKEPILTHRFYVVENKVSTSLTVKQPDNISLRQTHQELNVNIANPSFRINSSYKNLKVAIMQNGRTDNMYIATNPTFVYGESIVYNQPNEIVFEGGSEFRAFNIRTLQTTMYHVARNSYIGNANYSFLYTDSERQYLPYDDQKDNNGYYFITSDDGDSLYGADYTNVYFSYDGVIPYDMDIYVFGELTNWRLLPEAKLEYDDYKKNWKTSLYLRMGYYNYCYLAVFKNKTKGYTQYTEGNHWQTKNRYNAFVYYQGDNLGYDRIIGYTEYFSNNGMDY